MLTTLPSIVSNLDKLVLERNLQASLQRWCRENGMVLSIEKTKVMLITSRQKRVVLNNAVLNLQYNDIRQNIRNKKIKNKKYGYTLFNSTYFMKCLIAHTL